MSVAADKTNSERNRQEAIWHCSKTLRILSADLSLSVFPERDALHRLLDKMDGLEHRLAQKPPPVPAPPDAITSATSIVAPPGFCYVDILKNGRRGLTPKLVAIQDAIADADEMDYDLVCMDLDQKRKFIFRKNGMGKREEQRVSPMLRRMLLLAMENAGDQIEHVAFRMVEGSENVGPKDLANRIARYKTLLIELLGSDLHGKIFPEIKLKHAYRISKRDWSFCWIRLYAEVELSNLLR